MCTTLSVLRNFTTGTVPFISFRVTIGTDYVYQMLIYFYVLLHVPRTLCFLLYTFENFHLLYVVILQRDLSFYVCVDQHV